LSKVSDSSILAELTALAKSVKFASDCPDWQVITERKGERLQLTCPLWIEDNIQSGLRLELIGPKATPANRPHYGFKSLMFANIANRTWHLGRIEFDPDTPVGVSHRNPFNAKHVPPTVTGAHFHSFDDNVAYGGLSSLSQDSDLPVARALDTNINNYSDILAVIRELYIIPDLWLEEPAWSRTLL